MPDEIWKPVVGYEGLYEVSNLGRVRSVGRVVTYRNGRRVHCRSRVLKPAEHPAGHLHVILCRVGKHVTAKVHRVVLEAFVGPCPEGMEGCHNDGNPADNALGNLRWDTHGANMRDRGEHGTGNEGERHGNSTLTEAVVLEIRQRYASEDITQTALARQYGLRNQHISKIVNRQLWTHI